jgi:hypothetical protein
VRNRKVDLHARIGRAIGGRREHLGETLPVVLRSVELFEAFEIVAGEVRVAQHAQGLRMPGLDLEDAAPRLGGARLIGETIGVDTA